MTHGMNSIYIILDLVFVTGVPVRLYHIIHPALVAVIYVIFNIIYDVTGGKLIDMIDIMTEILETFLLKSVKIDCLSLLFLQVLFFSVDPETLQYQLGRLDGLQRFSDTTQFAFVNIYISGNCLVKPFKTIQNLILIVFLTHVFNRRTQHTCRLYNFYDVAAFWKHLVLETKYCFIKYPFLAI